MDGTPTRTQRTIDAVTITTIVLQVIARIYISIFH